MKLEIIRRYYTEKTTIGDLYIDGKFYCNTLEDKTRAPWETKIWGETAIPAGEYPASVTFSPKFNTQMTELFKIPGYSKVRIHKGNKSDDTEGCILVGKYSSSTPDWVSESKAAYDTIWPLIWSNFVHKKDLVVKVSDIKDFGKQPEKKVARPKK